MRKNIAAFTSTDIVYPSYISINVIDDEIEVTVRSEATYAGECGDISTIKMNEQEFLRLLAELYGNFMKQK